MSAAKAQLISTLRLHFRNTMALVYSYLFPTIFLVAFWMLYRYDKVPLLRHMGELLTVTALGGACFGLPTTLVNERERGVWRRYRLAPASSLSLVGSTLVARYLLLLVAGLLQVILAMAIGMPLPTHPFGLLVSFTCVVFAFLGLGLVIAAAADNVPAVQALGQCLFLPMLIIGGVAVPLASLPEWAQRVATFFPGRYAVDAIQKTVSGDGLDTAVFSLAALVVIGTAACVAGVRMFRWDAGERFVARGGKGWIPVALSAWVAVGVFAQTSGRLTSSAPTVEATRAPAPTTSPMASATATEAERAATSLPAPASTPASRPPAPNPPSPSASPSPATPSTATPSSPPAAPAGASASPAPAAAPPTAPIPPPGPASWQDVTVKLIDEEIIFTRLPPDGGVVTPVAEADEVVGDEYVNDLEYIRTSLPQWAPAKVADPLQRVRNLLYVAAVPDVFQSPLERFVPPIVFERLRADVPEDQLVKILYWIAVHPMDGDDKAVDQMRVLGLGNGPSDMNETRQRVGVYAVKLLGRVLGRIKASPSGW